MCLPFYSLLFYEPLALYLPDNKHLDRLSFYRQSETLPDARPRIAYLRLAGVNSQQYTIDFLSPRLTLAFAREFENIMSLYFGALLAILAYNGFLFVSVRDRGYLLYTFYLASTDADQLRQFDAMVAQYRVPDWNRF